MGIRLNRLLNWIEIVKGYIALMFGEDHVQLWSIIRYSADIVLCHKRYGASIADYFELHFYEKTHRERKTYFTKYQAL